MLMPKAINALNPWATRSVPRKQAPSACTIAEFKRFYQQLSKSQVDLKQLQQYATASISPHKTDIRSVIMPLQTPIKVGGQTIVALRLKGIFPKVGENGKVKRYVKGNGAPELLLEVAQKNTLTVRARETEADYKPLGTMGLPNLVKEADSALLLRSAGTDMLLGIGLFANLSFDNQEVGFLIYGLEKNEDIRIYDTYFETLKNRGDLLDQSDLAIRTGQQLRKMHQLGIFHRYPHLGNFACRANGLTKIVDLEFSSRLASLPRESWPAYLYLDVSRVINDYQKSFYYDREDDMVLTCSSLLPFFLWGYFGKDQSLDLVQTLITILDSTEKHWLRREAFGELPYFSPNYREGGTFTLVEPTIRLYAEPQQASGQPSLVDLASTEFTTHPRFGPFYQALKVVAERI